MVSVNFMKSSALHTASFIEFVDNLFDIFNSISFNEPKIMRRPFQKDSCLRDFLLKADTMLCKLKIHNKTGNQPPCIKGWRENINALKLLFNEINTKYKIEYLLTRRLTQDCIENAFSIIRAKGGNNVTPDASKFQSAVRMYMCNNLLTPSKGGNCDSDESEFFAKCADLKKK